MVKKMKVLNEILDYNMKIYQDNDWFCFSIDSIILANFLNIRQRAKKILDLGTGNAIIPLILSRRTNSIIEGVEIQKDLVDLANNSIKYNKLEDRIKIYNCDIKEFGKNKKLYNTYDIIVCNPPYFKKNANSIKNLDVHKAIARHEMCITLEDIFQVAFNLLKEGAVYATVNRVDRFVEIMELFKKYKFEVKYIRFVYDNVDSKPSLFYIEGIKCGNSGLIIDRPFIMYDKNNIETDEYKKIKEGKI